MATRRVGTGTFDHGAQFFTVRGDRFAEPRRGLARAQAPPAEWTRGFADAEGRPNEDGHPRYRGSRGMTSIPDYLARGLDVRTGERAVGVKSGTMAGKSRTRRDHGLRGQLCCSRRRFPKRWTCLFEGAPGCRGGAGSSSKPSPTPHASRSWSCWTVRPACPSPAESRSKASPWIGSATTRRKGISEAPAITIHAGPEWSRAHFEDEEATGRRALISLRRRPLAPTSRPGSSSLPSPVALQLGNEPPPGALPRRRGDPPLLFCGDAFGQPKVEGAALSGLAAADCLGDPLVVTDTDRAFQG